MENNRGMGYYQQNPMPAVRNAGVRRLRQRIEVAQNLPPLWNSNEKVVRILGAREELQDAWLHPLRGGLGTKLVRHNLSRLLRQQ